MPDLGHGAVGNGHGPACGARAVRGRGGQDGGGRGRGGQDDDGLNRQAAQDGNSNTCKGKKQESEWHRGEEPNTPTERFNRAHSSIRNVIERSFGLLKMKWQTLWICHHIPCTSKR
jgi:hypothetical protein